MVGLMKISAIKPAVKTPGRFNIFVDGKYNFSLTQNQLLETGLRIGSEIDQTRLAQLKSESDFGKKYMRALELIMRRPRSEKELKDYARRKDWELEDYERVSQRLRAKNYLNDRNFVQFWLRARANSKPSSRRKLIAELCQKGIASAIIEDALTAEDAPDEAQALRQIIEKKRSKYDDRQKFIAYLARQGFRYDDIKQALD